MHGNLKLFVGLVDVGGRADRLPGKALLSFNTCVHICTYTYLYMHIVTYRHCNFKLNVKIYSNNQEPTLKLISTCKSVKINARSYSLMLNELILKNNCEQACAFLLTQGTTGFAEHWKLQKWEMEILVSLVSRTTCSYYLQ